jgi:multiple antibiotic resistance protein
MTAWLTETFLIFVTLLAMVNPVEAAAAFATLTEGRSSQDQAQIARRATFVGFAILIAFGYAGEALLHALGVSIQAFEIAGGVLLLKVGFNMVFAEKTDSETADNAKAIAKPRSDPSVFPLAIPIITGPGALTASVTLLSGEHNQFGTYGIFLIMAVVVFALTYLAMRSATRLTEILGRTGVDATGRLVGIIVAAIAVQLIINGVAGITHGLLSVGH